MRARLPLIAVALTMLFALVASGCGDDKSSDSATPPGATQSAGPGATGSSGSASASATAAYSSCLRAASSLPDSAQSDAKKRCKQAYENIKDASAKIDQSTSEARAKCKEAANQIPNADAKASALAACDKFR